MIAVTPVRPSLRDVVDPEVLSLAEPSRSSRAGMLDLSRNELVHPGLADLLATLVSGIGPETAARYPVYRPWADELAELVGHQPAEIEVFPGSDDAIGVLLDALSRSRRHVLLQEPNYPGYRYHCTLRGVDVQPWMPRPGEHRFAVEDAATAMVRRPHGITVVTDPHGNLGSSFSDAELAALLAVAQVHDHLLIIDRCYAAFSAPGPGQLAGSDGVVIVSSFSKSFGLAGLRLGIVAGPPELVSYLRRWRRAGAVSALTLQVALQALRQHRAAFDQIRADVVAGRDWLAGQLSLLDPTCRPLPSEANFLTIDLRTASAAADAVARLAKRGVAVRSHRDEPAFDSLVQITAAPVEVLQRVVDALDGADTASTDGAVGPVPA